MLGAMKVRAGRPLARVIGILLPLLAILGSGAGAQDQLKGGPTPSPPGAKVYFIGLEDGATVPTKFSVNFGLERMGVAPAGSDRANSGHHHLLIDTDLPPLDEPVPNDFNHLHFGAGQTEATVTLRPGEHTLQLLLADKDHIPHSPPVMSARIKIHVVNEMPPAPPPPSARSRTPSPPGAGVYFVGLRDGATVQRRLRIRFGLRNMGIAPAGSDRENSGHHHLLIDTDLPPLDQPIPNDFNHLHFGNGETETIITLSPGQHTLQLLLADGDHVPHDPPVASARIRVNVVEAVAAPKPATEPNSTPATPPAPSAAPPPDSAPPAAPTPPHAAAHEHGGPASAAGSSPPTSVTPDAAPPVAPSQPSTSTTSPARQPTPSPAGAEAYFVDLQDGASVPSQVTVTFGLRNMHVVPAGFVYANSGHYHLLIDADVPPLDQPIPEDANHLHFDKGQKQAVLTLTPGEHTLQLLLGDKDNFAHAPPVLSPRITVRVADRPRNRKPSPRGAKAFFIGQQNGDRIPTTVTLRFGVDNMDITRVGAARDSAHYHLLIDRELPPLDQPIPQDANHLDFPDGQTQAKITLTPGEHTLQLLLGDDNHMAHNPPVVSKPLKVVVGEFRNRDDRNRDDRVREDSQRRDGPQRIPAQSGPARQGSAPAQNDSRPSRYGPHRESPRHRYRRYRDEPYRYRPYRYGPYPYDRGWRPRNYYYPD